MVEFLEHVLAFSLKQDLVDFHLSFAEEWLFFCVFSKESKFFAAEEKSLKYHESFPFLIFEGSLSIEMHN